MMSKFLLMVFFMERPENTWVHTSVLCLVNSLKLDFGITRLWEYIGYENMKHPLTTYLLLEFLCTLILLPSQSLERGLAPSLVGIVSLGSWLRVEVVGFLINLEQQGLPLLRQQNFQFLLGKAFFCDQVLNMEQNLKSPILIFSVVWENRKSLFWARF